MLVTGGGSGIGAAIVRAFAEQQAHVCFLDIDCDASEYLVRSLSHSAYPPIFRKCDVTDLGALAETIGDVQARSGLTEVLINNAANDTRHAIADISPEAWDDNIAVNLRHLFFCAQAVLPGMQANGAGVILNLGSISWHRALPDLALYVTAKAAIEGLTRGLAKDLGKSGIRVNSIIPGAVRTPRQTRLWHTPEEESNILAGQCLQKRVEPEHVAAMALFLASQNAASCTGRDYFVDAGWYGT
ncbi:MAG: SDR family oxidoreductase [Burkholderiales bacterium]|nr:MAG: SDR family oxidoreductase [Burkholderiales bacterium]